MLCHRSGAAFLVMAALAGLPVSDTAAGHAATPIVRSPKVVDVPSRPAFVKLPGQSETPARAGQILQVQTVLRTEKPGRMQVQLADGRSFRLGGDALLRLATGRTLELRRGQIIAWVNPDGLEPLPLRVRTRVGTVSIVGTTVFIDASEEVVKVFSWEGNVRIVPDVGAPVMIQSGEEVSHTLADGWQPVRRLSRQELDTRRARSILLNGFEAPMDTLPVIERELGFSQ
jgi:hypothetical protein